MKRGTLFAAVLALALALTACGAMDDGAAGTVTDRGTGGVNGTVNSGRNTMGGDLADGAREAVRDVERGVDDLLDTAPRTAAGANTTSFQRMLDNARVHDADGVLSDGENSRW